MKENKGYILAGIIGIAVIFAGIILICVFRKEKTNETAALSETETSGEIIAGTGINERYLTRNERIVICIDPGHGGSDGGAENGDNIEKEHNLKLACKVRDYLMKYDVDVILTRDDDTEISKNDRVFIANENYADVLVSLHRNNYVSPAACGFEIWIGKLDEPEDRRLAEIIMDSIKTVPGTQVRGIFTGSTTDRDEDYIINRHSLMPSCLIEMGFISNAEDNRLFLENMDEYARLISEGILEYLSVDTDGNIGE